MCLMCLCLCAAERLRCHIISERITVYTCNCFSVARLYLRLPFTDSRPFLPVILSQAAGTISPIRDGRPTRLWLEM
jgi:hypothetical protein